MLVNAYTVSLLIVAIVSMGLAFYAVPQRAMPGARPYIVLALLAAGWSLGYALELSSLTLVEQLFWVNAEYLFIVCLPAAWLVFALQYAGRNDRLTPRFITLLLIEPLIVVVLAWTDEYHHLFRSSVTMNTSGAFPYLVIGRTPFFWFHILYSYSLMVLGAGLFLQAFWRSPRPYRSQAIALLIGALFPFGVNILSIFNLNPFTSLDLTPFAFMVSGLAFFWSLFRHRLLGLSFLPRHSVIENLGDGVIVLDPRHRIIDLNPAAARLLRVRPDQVIGDAADSLLARYPSLTEHLNRNDDSSLEIQIEMDGETRCYDVQLSLLIKEHGVRVIGKLIVWHDVTAGWRAEQGLADFFNLSVDMIGFANLNGYFTRVNSAFEWTLGWTADEMLKTPYIKFVHPDDVQETARVLGKLASGDSLHNLQNRFRRKDGSYRWLSWSVQHAAEGKLYAIARDISDLKQTEFALRESSAYLESLNEITRATVEKTDLNEMLQTLADQLGRLLKADGCFITLWDDDQQRTIPAAAYGELQTDYRSLKILPDEVTMTASVLKEGRILIAENVFDTPYISPRIAALFPMTRSMLGLPLIVGGQKLGAALLSFHQHRHFTEDDTFRCAHAASQIALALAKAKLFQAIADERGQLRALIESSRDGIILTGMDRRILVTNEPALRLLRLSQGVEDWIGRPLRDALILLRRHAPEVVKATIAEVRRVEHGDEPLGEGHYELPPRIIHWSNLPVMAGDKPLGRLIVLRDVTEERSLEKMRDTLTHTMVHDLRNPLSSLYTGIDTLDIDPLYPLSTDQKEIAAMLLHNTLRMLNLVNSILDVTRLESGEMPLARTLVALTELIKDVFEIELPLTLTKKIQLQKELPPDLPLLYVDAGFVQRILQNLIGNAIKFTPENGRITVSARREETNPSVIEVAVKDSGGGVPIEIQNRLFQKFVAGRQAGRGSGLGLAFCKLAVEAHGGHIWMESTGSTGTTFKFTLPIEKN